MPSTIGADSDRDELDVSDSSTGEEDPVHVGFSGKANLDKGGMWPTSFALKGLTATEEKKIGALVKKAVR